MFLNLDFFLDLSDSLESLFSVYNLSCYMDQCLVRELETKDSLSPPKDLLLTKTKGSLNSSFRSAYHTNYNNLLDLFKDYVF